MGDEGVEEAQICREDFRRVREVERGEKKDYGVFFLYQSMMLLYYHVYQKLI